MFNCVSSEEVQPFVDYNSSALLTLDNAMQHLNHFCASLKLGTYVNSLPQFEFMETQLGKVTAKVTLPISVDPVLRSAISLEGWRTERSAKKDAAFQAYKALYLAGLVNDNLLPLRHEVEEEAAQYQLLDYRPSVVPVSPTFDPWPLIAQCQQHNPQLWNRVLLEVNTLGEEPICMVLLTPNLMPEVPMIPLYWNETRLYRIRELETSQHNSR